MTETDDTQAYFKRLRMRKTAYGGLIVSMQAWKMETEFWYIIPLTCQAMRYMHMTFPLWM